LGHPQWPIDRSPRLGYVQRPVTGA